MKITEREQIGRLNKRITIRQETASQNDYGEEVLSWSDLAEVWANVNYRSGQEKDITDRQSAVTRVDFTIYARTDIDEKMQITYNGDTYDILAILETEGQHFQIIEAEKRE